MTFNILTFYHTKGNTNFDWKVFIAKLKNEDKLSIRFLLFHIKFPNYLHLITLHRSHPFETCYKAHYFKYKTLIINYNFTKLQIIQKHITYKLTQHTTTHDMT